MKNVLITGCMGYIGNAVTQRMLFKGYNVVGIDSMIKYHTWTQDVVSVIEQHTLADTLTIFKRIGNFKFYRLDIVRNTKEVEKIMGMYKFDTIINLAQQPSAAYSMQSLANALESINNNTNGTLSLLWLMRRYCPEAHFIEIESLGTIQPDIGVDIPENYFCFQYNNKESKPSLFPRRPSSFYHASKVFNTYLNDSVVRWWNLKITAINQGVVYGAYTPEIEQTGVHSPLWVDEAFGTAVHRFIVQALLKHPFTIYGSGNQKRGFLSLNDSVQCVELFVDNPLIKPDLRMPNQIDEVLSINQVVDKVDKIIPNEKMFIESPRVENTDDFYYNPVNETIKSLGFKQTRTIEQEVEYCIDKIDKSTLHSVSNLVIPKTTWR